MTTRHAWIGRARWLVYGTHYVFVDSAEWVLSKLLYSPLLRARCRRAGEQLSVTSFPRIRGEARITVGRGCTFSTFDVEATGVGSVPELSFGDYCFVANNARFTVARRVSIGSHVGIAPWVDVRDAVTIEDHAWIGRGAHIANGVRIGNHAIVAAGSIVLHDVPGGALAMGSPARIIRIA